MKLDPKTVMILMGVLGLLLTGLATLLWWTRRSYPGFGHWATAGPLAALSLYLMDLRPKAPELVSMIGANALLAFATVLYVEGARRIRGRPSGSGLVYAGGVLTMSGYAFFLYVDRNANARAALMSAFMGGVLLLAARTLSRRGPDAPSFGLWLTASMFALCGTTHLIRAAYNYLGPHNAGLFLSGVQGALDYGTAVPMSLFPIGFLLLADERVVSELFVAKERVLRSETEAARYHQAEAVLRESERLFRTMANAAPVMIWMADVDQRCTYFNQGWLDFTGRPLDAELGNGWTECIHSDDGERWLKTYAEAFDRREPFRMEYRLRRRDGEYRWLFVQGVPRFSAEGTLVGYIGSGIDITERKLAEEALSTLGRKLIAAQEQERARIARELHDDIGQQLALLAVEIEQFRGGGGRLTSAEGLAVDATERAQRLARSLHDLTHRLHPQMLEHVGLVSALSSLARELSRPDFTVAFTHDGVPAALPQEITIGLFRVVQEALHNAVKHSRAASVSVRMNGSSDGLALIIADEGVGFDAACISPGTGLGLISMGERLTSIGGSLEIMSRPRGGTRLKIRVPLPAPTVAAQSSAEGPHPHPSLI
jgi:PAS domain S-box-containing protein